MSINAVNTETIGSTKIHIDFSFNNLVSPSSKILELGRILLVNGNSVVSYSATSGLAGYQYLGASKLRGRGRIPTCHQAKIVNYQVSTMPIYLPNTKGVNGNFYPITPFKVEVDGNPRSDLGIHRDTNVAGSAGCIVIRLADHWQLFETAMRKLVKENIMNISLFVN
jgi:hypothetical protein